MSYHFAKLYRPKRRNPAIGDPGLQLHLKLFLLAMDRMQRGGHAPLGSGELQLILTREDGRPYTAGRYSQALTALKDAGLLAPSASARCLLVPNTVASMDAPSRRKREECATHGHNIPWDGEANDWLHPTPEQARKAENEADNVSRDGSAFSFADWARGLREQPRFNETDTSAAQLQG
ncbi:hypothetical protein ACIRVF_21850 [Kitasatospora sp. NPDC101157]|uniref:hypothetical protein n=1 Tax=Kitasatospora sp. NPDC101157 TaxID=3364098 RepID=UPI00381FEE66